MSYKKLLNPLLATDSYKHSHHGFLPDDTTLIYSHLTPRGNQRFLYNYPDHDGKVVVFGISYLLQKLEEHWFKGFFNRKWSKIEKETLDVLGHHLGFTKADLSKFKQLHELGYLPLEISAIDEGECVNVGVPILTVHNTHTDFPWLTNFIESFILNTLYPAITAATITREFAKLRDKYFDITVSDQSLKGFHLHNFSYRGCMGHEVAGIIGAAHNLFTKITPLVITSTWIT
jgi:nicotinamide phosphoribosyltransferase